MKDKNFSRSISLQCPTCGTTTLLNDQDIEQVRCARCGREMTMNRLIEENGENIHSHVNEIQKDLEKKLIKDLSDKLKKTFKGNKNIRIK